MSISPQYLRLTLALALCLSSSISSLIGQSKPNVLFISIDDLNDWVSAFGGHPKAQTPHLDRFADEGAVVFQNAHCAGPVCGPSRSAMLSGFMPHRTGAYGNANNMLESPLIQDHATLPEYFSNNGYVSLSKGKIFHRHNAAHGADAGQWAFDQYVPVDSDSGPDPDRLTSRIKNVINGEPGPPSDFTSAGGSEFAWGPTRLGIEGTKDYQTAQWAASQLQQEQEKPFFMAVGISRPHLPFYAPQEFFDLYDPKGKYAPPMREDDLEDILTPEGKQKFKPSNDYLWLKQNDLFDEAARAYLAASSYADACLGVIFDALKKSPHYDNTIVMVWGDHGWHLGEKLRYRKAALWTEATRMPLMVRLPGMNRRQDCERVVNMIDFYPTLIELCQLPQKPVLDGRSFAPLLANPNRDWNYPTMTINGSGNVSIHDERWHYIEYRDGTQELYDLQHDPQEWTNLVLQLTETSSSAMKRLQRYAPKKFAPSISNSKNRYPKSNGLDLTIKVTRDLAKLK